MSLFCPRPTLPSLVWSIGVYRYSIERYILNMTLSLIRCIAKNDLAIIISARDSIFVDDIEN